jgi:beta-barrel assembly-enhancing protease
VPASRSTRWIPSAVVLVTVAAAACAPRSQPPPYLATLDPERIAAIEEHVVRQLLTAHLERYVLVQRVAAGLRRANTDRCDGAGGDFGITLLSPDLIPEWMEPFGAPLLQMEKTPRIVEVRAGSPAEAAGIRAGDWLHSVEGRTAGSAADLVRAETAAPGPVRLGISRGDSTRAVQLVPDEACPPYPVRLVVNPEPGAFAMNGGIIVTTGLFAIAHGEDELAFVLAHEMGHLMLGHTGAITSEGMESEADLVALELMTGARYEPAGALTFLLRLAAESHVPVDRKAIVVRLAVLEARIQDESARAEAAPPSSGGSGGEPR